MSGLPAPPIAPVLMHEGALSLEHTPTRSVYVRGARSVDLYIALWLPFKDANSPELWPVIFLWWAEYDPLGYGEWYREMSPPEPIDLGPRPQVGRGYGEHPLVRQLAGIEDTFLLLRDRVKHARDTDPASELAQLQDLVAYWRVRLEMNATWLRLMIQGQIGAGGRARITALPGL